MTTPNTQPGAAPATGNTEKEQEMYAAGIETGEANAKNNAAIRTAAAPGDAPGYGLWWHTKGDPQERHRALAARQSRLAQGGAPVAGEAQPAAYLTLDEEGSPCMLFFDVVEARAYCEVGEEPEALWRRPAYAAGDAQDAARYRSFRKALTRMDTTWLDRVGAALEALGLNPDDDVLPTAEQVDAAFDAARAAFSATRAEQGERDA